MMIPLDPKEIKNKLSTLSSNWVNENNRLVGEFQFVNYLAALAFVNNVAELAEKQRHHPNIEFNYCKVKLFLTTHDLNNQLSEKDFELALAIEKIKSKAR